MYGTEIILGFTEIGIFIWIFRPIEYKCGLRRQNYAVGNLQISQVGNIVVYLCFGWYGSSGSRTRIV